MTRTTLLTVLFTFVGFAMAPSASAEIYQYEVNGEIVFTSEPLAGHSPVRVERTPASQQPSDSAEPWSAPVAGGNVNTAFDGLIREASATYTLPFEFIKAVIHVESAFDPTALSHAGAMGLMQLMPGTAQSLGCTDPFNARQNVLAGALYLRILINRYNGDINLALAAYNAGPANVDRAGGIPFAETERYVERVLRLYDEYGLLAQQ